MWGYLLVMEKIMADNNKKDLCMLLCCMHTHQPIEVYTSISDAVEALGITDSNIARAASGKRLSAQGFKWGLDIS